MHTSKFIRIILLLNLIFLVFCLAGCKSKESLNKDYYIEGNQQVFIKIDYEGNLFFAKNDLDIYIDNHKFYTVSNGDVNENIYNLTVGKHVLKISSEANHYDSEEFEVKNTGDYFLFKVKNSSKNVNVSLNSSFNYYKLTNQEIPITIDDSDLELTEEQINSVKINKSFLNIIGSVIKSIITFILLFMPLFLVGILIYTILNSIYAIKLGMVLEFIAICILVLSDGFSIYAVLIAIGYLITYLSYYNKIREVPKEYRKFGIVEEKTKLATEIVISYIAPVIVLTIPSIPEMLPFKINYLNFYMYAYMVVIIVFTLYGMSEDLLFPIKVEKLIESTDIISQINIEEFVNANSSPEDSEDFEKKTYETLADFVRIGILEKDDEEKIFRKKC